MRSIELFTASLDKRSRSLSLCLAFWTCLRFRGASVRCFIMSPPASLSSCVRTECDDPFMIFILFRTDLLVCMYGRDKACGVLELPWDTSTTTSLSPGRIHGRVFHQYTIRKFRMRIHLSGEFPRWFLGPIFIFPNNNLVVFLKPFNLLDFAMHGKDLGWAFGLNFACNALALQMVV